MTRRVLSKIWNGHRRATASEAVAILHDPVIRNTDVNLHQLLGVFIPPGTPIAHGLVSAPIEDLVVTECGEARTR